MTKTLQEIEQENHGLIHVIILNTKYVSIRQHDLGIILLCLQDKIQTSFCINWNKIIFLYLNKEGTPDTFAWSLTEATLELQEESVQRIINKLLTEEND